MLQLTSSVLATTPSSPRIFIVDDQPDIRDTLVLLLKTVGLQADIFDSAEDFLVHYQTDWCGCLILDVRMPSMSGIELQQVLNQRQSMLAILFMSGHGDVNMAAKTMCNGASFFLQKPFNDQEFLDQVKIALKRSTEQSKARYEQALIRSYYDTLTDREREVLALLLAGKENKVIARLLQNLKSKKALSQRTVEVHRARIMKKMRADSLVTLVKMMSHFTLGE